MKVTFVQPDGRRMTVEVESGTTLKDCAIDNGIDGIVGECGGAAMCATCHVYADETDAARVGGATEIEADLLEIVEAEVRATSRLSCQLTMSEALDGIVLHIPAAH